MASSYYTGQNEIIPKSISDPSVAKVHSQEYLFMACVDHINKVTLVAYNTQRAYNFKKINSVTQHVIIRKFL